MNISRNSHGPRAPDYHRTVLFIRNNIIPVQSLKAKTEVETNSVLLVNYDSFTQKSYK